MQQCQHALKHLSLAPFWTVVLVPDLERLQPLSYVVIGRWKSCAEALGVREGKGPYCLYELTCCRGSRKTYRNERDFEANLVHGARLSGAGGVDDRDGVTIAIRDAFFLHRVTSKTAYKQLIERALEWPIPRLLDSYMLCQINK